MRTNEGAKFNHDNGAYGQMHVSNALMAGAIQNECGYEEH